MITGENKQVADGAPTDEMIQPEFCINPLQSQYELKHTFCNWFASQTTHVL